MVRWLAVCLCLAWVAVDASQEPSAALIGAMRDALRPALPYPEARADGTAPDSSPDPVWTVRWPSREPARVEVLANPLNAGNHERAMRAEEAIQKSAMQSQQRSQSDYEQALRDFQRSGRVGTIREVSLNDEGLAGERYDAESQLIIDAHALTGNHRFEVRTSRAPEVFRGSDGPSAVVRLAANEYEERGDGTEPPVTRFCPEQAWVVFGSAAVSVDAQRGDATAQVSVTSPAGPGAARVVVIALRGNVELVDRVLQQANWASLRAYAGP